MLLFFPCFFFVLSDEPFPPSFHTTTPSLKCPLFWYRHDFLSVLYRSLSSRPLIGPDVESSNCIENLFSYVNPPLFLLFLVSPKYDVPFLFGWLHHCFLTHWTFEARTVSTPSLKALPWFSFPSPVSAIIWSLFFPPPSTILFLLDLTVPPPQNESPLFSLLPPFIWPSSLAKFLESFPLAVEVSFLVAFGHFFPSSSRLSYFPFPALATILTPLEYPLRPHLLSLFIYLNLSP